MNQLLEDDIVTPSTTSEQSSPKKRGRPRKTQVQSTEPEAVASPTESPQPKTVDPRNALNELTSTEWRPETISVWNQRGLGANHPDAQIERQHTAPISFTDVSRLVRFFTKSGDVVLDPFVGVGSTLKACAVEGRNGIGFELNPRYAELAEERLRVEVKDMFSSLVTQDVRVGDARELIKNVPDNSLDLVVTSPPYWNILHKIDHKAKQEREVHDLDTKYSEDERDLGNIHEYEVSLEGLASILGSCGRALKPKKHMAVIGVFVKVGWASL